jgi:hypothetical protein
LHVSGDPEVIWKENETGIRRPPEDWFPFGKPGKDPLTIGEQEALRGKIAADGQ